MWSRCIFSGNLQTSERKFILVVWLGRNERQVVMGRVDEFFIEKHSYKTTKIVQKLKEDEKHSKYQSWFPFTFPQLKITYFRYFDTHLC